jgi:hypothetical protein
LGRFYFYAVVTEGESASRISANSKLSSAFVLTSIKLIAVIRIAMENSLLKNSMGGVVRVVRRFSAAYKPFIFCHPESGFSR